MRNGTEDDKINAELLKMLILADSCFCFVLNIVETTESAPLVAIKISLLGDSKNNWNPFAKIPVAVFLIW